MRDPEDAMLRDGPLAGRLFLAVADVVTFNDGKRIHRYRFSGYGARNVNGTDYILKMFDYDDSWQHIDETPDIT